MQIVTIQYLRALAALAVVAYHALDASSHPFKVGSAGVDLFFVISGFIMWMTTARGASPGRFLLHRVIRIVPLYWLVTLAVVGLAVSGRALQGLRITPDHVLQSLLFVPHAGPSGETFPVVVVGWTLNFEMFFYAVFAACLLLPRARQHWALAALLTLATVAGASGGSGPLFETYTNPLLLEFVAGVLLCRLWERGWLPSPGLGVGSIVLGLSALAIVPFRPAERALWWGVPALLIAMGTLSLEQKLQRKPIAWLKALGDASYSIYLIHPLVISVLVKRIHQPAVLVPATFVACALVGIVCYRLFEQPVGRALRGWFVPERRDGPEQAVSPTSPGPTA